MFFNKHRESLLNNCPQFFQSAAQARFDRTFSHLQYSSGFRNREIHKITQVEDRKSTRLNSSHSQNSYAVFCLKKKTIQCSRVTSNWSTGIPYVCCTFGVWPVYPFSIFLLLMIRLPPLSTLFPYTTLFRSA